MQHVKYLLHVLQSRQTEVDELQLKNKCLTETNAELAGLALELQKRVDAALQEIKGAARWIEEDAIDDPEFIKGGVLRVFARLEQALTPQKGGTSQ